MKLSSWFRSNLDGAGLSRLSTGWFVAAVLAVAILLDWVFSSLFRVQAFGLCIALAFVGLAVELLDSRAKARRLFFSRSWPEVIDSLQSAAAAGIPIAEALGALAIDGPKNLRTYFAAMIQSYDSGQTLDQALGQLKCDFGDANADRVIELLLITKEAGTDGYLSALKLMGQTCRSEIATWDEVRSKQGWVGGTAKLAIAAPWVIVAMLSSRQENVTAYASSGGSAILFLGLVISVVAYLMIRAFGSLVSQPRVFG